MMVKKINDSQPGFLRATDILFNNALVTRNLLIIGLLLTTLVFQRTRSLPSGLTNRSADGNGGFVFPRTEDPWRSTEGAEDNTMKRETSHQRNDVGGFFFPTDEPEINHGEKIFTPPSTPECRRNIFTPGPPPECQGKTYCENIDSYPVNCVKNVIQKQDDLKFLAGVDEIDSITQRISDDGSTALCPSVERLIFPTAAQNRENNWLFILNDDYFKQGVRIETCLKPDGECTVIGGFIEGYKTMCKQKYILRQLAALTSNGTGIRDMFKLPSSCCCHVKFDGVYSRMGISLRSNSNDQTTIFKKRRRRREN